MSDEQPQVIVIDEPRQQVDSSRRIHLVNQADEIERIFRKAVRHELSIHKRLGNPIATWKDGKVVIIPPEEMPVDDPE